MRLRRRKTTKDVLRQQPELIVLEPRQYRERWHEFFGNDGPVHAELGMGKGKFISELSAGNPDINYVGIDMYDELIRKASEKARELWLEQHGQDCPANLAVTLFNIEKIEEIFGEGELQRIYLNFSDPWPKQRHARRRLTHPRFVRKYVNLLNEDGEIHFKTDSRELFEFSLNAFADMGLQLSNISLDLHRNGSLHHVMTEYETKFVEQGMPIYRCEVVAGRRALERHREEKNRQLAGRQPAGVTDNA